MATAAELAATIVPAYGCAACNDQVLSSLARRTLIVLRQVRDLKAYTAQFANLGSIVTAAVVADVQTLVSAIPSPLSINIADIPGYITCPLLPLAIEVVDIDEILALDPRSQLDRIRQLTVGWVAELRANYERALKNLSVWQTVRIFKGYIDAIKRFGLNAVAYADALLIATSVQGICPDAYMGSVFEEFIEETSGFSITGIVPTGLAGHVASVAQALGEAEVKLAGWSVIAGGGTIPV